MALSFCFCVFCFPLQSHAAKRVALVIGNASYTTSPLKNPANDAVDMANLLKKLGFEVIRETKQVFGDTVGTAPRAPD